jgi:hypothetical protein
MRTILTFLQPIAVVSVFLVASCGDDTSSGGSGGAGGIGLSNGAGGSACVTDTPCVYGQTTCPDGHSCMPPKPDDPNDTPRCAKLYCLGEGAWCGGKSLPFCQTDLSCRDGQCSEGGEGGAANCTEGCYKADSDTCMTGNAVNACGRPGEVCIDCTPNGCMFIEGQPTSCFP